MEGRCLIVLDILQDQVNFIFQTAFMLILADSLLFIVSQQQNKNVGVLVFAAEEKLFVKFFLYSIFPMISFITR